MEHAAQVFNWIGSVHQAIRDWDQWGVLAAAFIGTFVGAYVAFRLERKARAEDERKHRATEGNLALVTLFEMFNVLRQYQKDVVEKMEERDDRWLNLAVSLSSRFEPLSLDPSRLHFLLEGEDKNLLAELLLVARRYRHVAAIVQHRDQMMRDKILPLLGPAGITQGKAFPTNYVEGVVGQVLHLQAKTLADGIVSAVNENVQHTRLVFDKLRAQLVQQLTGEKFIRVDFDMPTKKEKKTA